MLTLATLGHTKRQNRFQIFGYALCEQYLYGQWFIPFNVSHKTWSEVFVRLCSLSNETEENCQFSPDETTVRMDGIITAYNVSVYTYDLGGSQCVHTCVCLCEREPGPGACGTLSWRMGRYPLVIAASSGMWVLDGPGSAGRWFVVVAYPLLCVIPGRSWAFWGLGSCPQLVLGWLASGQVSSLLHLVLWVSSLWRWGINLWPHSSFYGVEHTVFPGSCGLGSSILVCSWLTGDVAANCCPHYQERFALC